MLLLTGLILWAFDLPADLHVFDAVRLAPHSPVAPIAAGISALTGVSVLGPVAILVVFWLLWRRYSREALWLFLVITTGRLAIEAMKLGFQTPRPPESGRLTIVTSWSFPSSHSAGSMLTFLACAMLVRTHRGTAYTLAVAVACLVGWSRMALGVHWPSDVAAGLGLGMFWAGTAQGWLLKARLPSSQPLFFGGR